MSYELRAAVPGVVDYLRLREAGGLSPFTAEAAASGLPNSIFGVSILHDDAVVGMGRIIGDGGCFFQITDIVVDPAHQGKGLGKRIMRALMDHVETALPQSAYVSLIADVPADALYAGFGFGPVTPRSVGMAYRKA